MSQKLKVLVAGGTGALGRPLVRRLLERGHEVVAMSRTLPTVPLAGARHVMCDALDAQAVERAIADERPDAVVSQLTRLPKSFRPRALKRAYAENNRVRLEGTHNLLRASETHGVGRFVAQSAGFWYAPTPGHLKSEGDPLWKDAPEPIGEAVRTLAEMESDVRGARLPSWALMRYATFYGPGTWFSREGTVGRFVAKRRYPIVGDGAAVVSFIHVEDAAEATVAAVESTTHGTFNVADDEPAAMSQWLPAFADAVGAPPPRRVPAWVARLALGASLAHYTLNTRAAANAHAKRVLGWTPRFASWRQGFRVAL